MERTYPEENKVRIYGRTGSAVGYMIRDFLQRSDVPFEWIELISDEDARKQTGLTRSMTPGCRCVCFLMAFE